MQQLSEQQRIDAVASHIKSIIELLGENPDREGLVKTPVRAAKALWFLTSGYRADADAIMEQAATRRKPASTPAGASRRMKSNSCFAWRTMAVKGRKSMDSMARFIGAVRK